VDHGSCLPASRAVNTTALPSGEKVISSGPPKGLEGQSASMPFMTSTGSPPCAGMTKTCDLRPSFHVSQWRTNSLS